ncbi:MAG: 23S rRNA (pseudouridine(1915)-N(3))-methyltransferase RlmH [Patescibacteria group bacterium]|jgi:23S rRNA (pseudouridine1915-N3)-methyltransferase
MLEIILLVIGSVRDRRYQELIKDYRKRLKPYLRLTEIELKALSFTTATKSRARDYESERIRESLRKYEDSHLIYLLAERGQQFDSVALARHLRDQQPLVLVIGGSLGFSESLIKQYPAISLSALTLPHELARVVLFEQLFRAACILNNKEYHH